MLGRIYEREELVCYMEMVRSSSLPAEPVERREVGRASLGPVSVLSISRGAISIYFNENKTPRTGICVFFRDGAVSLLIEVRQDI